MPCYSNTEWMWRFSFGVRASQDLYELNKHPFSLQRCQMAVLNGLKKNSHFLGYWNPDPLPVASGLGNLTTREQTFEAKFQILLLAEASLRFITQCVVHACAQDQYTTRGWAEQEPRICAGTGYLVLVFEILIPAEPVQDIWQEKKR